MLFDHPDPPSTRTSLPVPHTQYPNHIIHLTWSASTRKSITLPRSAYTRLLIPDAMGSDFIALSFLQVSSNNLLNYLFYLQSTVQLSYSILIFIAMNRGDWSTTRKEISGMLVLGGIVHTITFSIVSNVHFCCLPTYFFWKNPQEKKSLESSCSGHKVRLQSC